MNKHEEIDAGRTTISDWLQNILALIFVYYAFMFFLWFSYRINCSLWRLSDRMTYLEFTINVPVNAALWTWETLQELW